jgi:hypothetical protein
VIADLVRVKSECSSKTPKQEARSVSEEQFPDEGATDFEHLRIERDGAQGGLVSPLGNHRDDAAYGGAPV